MVKEVKKESKPKVLKKKTAVLPVEKVAERFFEGLGRRKTSVARARLWLGGDSFLINGIDYKKYFPSPILQFLVKSPLAQSGFPGSFSVVAKVSGGGINSQATAIRLGISRALVKINPESYKVLRKLGFLTRDPRMRERKKFGLKRARKAPQWAKR